MARRIPGLAVAVTGMGDAGTMPVTMTLSEHSLRHQLTNEVHARPYETISGPARATHLTLATGELALKADRAHLHELCGLFGLEPPAIDATHFTGDFGSFRLRWERHTEFSTYTIFCVGPMGDDPFGRTALEHVPRDWLESLPGEVLVGLHVAITTGSRTAEQIQSLFGANVVVGSRMSGGAGAAWTDFRIHDDGFGRILIRDSGMTPGQCGRLVQRLVEIETYRMMALLAFPLARKIGSKLSAIDHDLGDIVCHMAAKDGEEKGDDRALLDRLTETAAEVEQLNATTNYRLSAARAYYQLVLQRIVDLREERIPGTQTVNEFMARRLAPAMKTCEATAERLDSLSRRVARAGDLLRTRVDIALEEKNRDLLNSMNRRAELQLRLQETVEGLSVVAISYYLLGLVGYGAKGAKAAGLPINPELVMLAGIPLVVAMVWLGVRRLRRALNHSDASHGGKQPDGSADS